ncbi:MAG: hypothetical protein K0U52_12070 [Gammaproteobacteria bacterium]|nr:hypothetical protein [Gammaproteobacteria bacterium]
MKWLTTLLVCIALATSHAAPFNCEEETSCDLCVMTPVCQWCPTSSTCIAASDTPVNTNETCYQAQEAPCFACRPSQHNEACVWTDKFNITQWSSLENTGNKCIATTCQNCTQTSCSWEEMDLWSLTANTFAAIIAIMMAAAGCASVVVCLLRRNVRDQNPDTYPLYDEL